MRLEHVPGTIYWQYSDSGALSLSNPLESDLITSSISAHDGMRDARNLIQRCTSLLRSSSFPALDSLLEQVQLTGALRSSLELVGALRATYPARPQLYRWPLLLEFAKHELASRGLNTDAELVGLSAEELEPAAVAYRTGTGGTASHYFQHERRAA